MKYVILFFILLGVIIVVDIFYGGWRNGNFYYELFNNNGNKCKIDYGDDDSCNKTQTLGRGVGEASGVANVVNETDSRIAYPPVSVNRFFNKYDFACIKPYDRPYSCANIVGNYFSIFPEKYCKGICPEMNKMKEMKENVKEEFLSPLDGIKDKKYWCWDGNKCVSHKYNPLEPNKNKCGVPTISQVPLQVYTSLEECNGINKPCGNLGYNECLQKSNCGWCTNANGVGICVPGTPMGPNAPTLQCWASTGKSGNTYIAGLPNQFVN